MSGNIQQQSAADYNPDEDEYVDVVGLDGDDEVDGQASNRIIERTPPDQNHFTGRRPNPNLVGSGRRKTRQPRQGDCYRFVPYRRSNKRKKRLSSLDVDRRCISLTPPPEGKEDNKTSKKTAYNEKWGVKMFRTWLTLKKFVPPLFETWPVPVLNQYLANFYTSVRKSNGDYYSRNSLFNLRAMINKHLKENSVVPDIDIVVDEEFREANLALEQQLKVLRIAGKKVNHKQPISDADLRMLYTSGTLSNKDPQSLLHKVWFETTYYFCSKPGESQDKWLTNSFVFSMDTELNLRYVTRKSDNADVAVRMYETDDQYCPVRSLRLYMSKLDSTRVRFFQHPKRQISDLNGVWFGGGAIGEKVLNSMMATISERAGTEHRYTNHCVRATASELVMRRNGKQNVDDQTIMHPTSTILPAFTMQAKNKPTTPCSTGNGNLMTYPATSTAPLIRYAPPLFTHDFCTQNLINAPQMYPAGLYMPQPVPGYPPFQPFFNTAGVIQIPGGSHQMLAAAAAASLNIRGPSHHE